MMEAAEKTKRPANSAFKQQRLAAWQPILTAGTVLPTFFVIGILFIPVGIGLLFFSDNVREIPIEYTDCIKKGTASITGNGTGIKCSDAISKEENSECECEPIKFEVKENLVGKVYIYYALTNFYQNHRRYVKSRDDQQLLGYVGDEKNPIKPDDACIPFQYSSDKKIILPCGAIANSMFTDKIVLVNKDGKDIPVISKGIAWESDKQYKFKNPSWWPAAKNNPSHPAWQKFTKPKGWKINLYELEDGIENEDFIVWMRTAALPNFRKLYRIVNHEASEAQGIRDGLPMGNYSLKITYSFPVTSFQGTKSVVISTTSLLGGKNPFLGISYIIVGAVCLILGIVFLFIHINYGKRNLVRPNEPGNNSADEDEDENVTNAR